MHVLRNGFTIVTDNAAGMVLYKSRRQAWIAAHPEVGRVEGDGTTAGNK